MKRRALTAIASFAVLGLPVAGARAAERVIGWISPEPRETIMPFFKAFQAGLQANTPASDSVRVIERHFTGGPEAWSQAAAELQKEGARLIVAQGGATLAVVRAKPAVPVVFAYSGDPVVAGIAHSFARPGGDATGMSFMSLELNPKRIDLVHLALPECRKVALLSNARHAGEENDIAATQRAVEGTGIELSVWRSQSPAETPAVIGQALDAGAQALVVLPSSPMVQQAAAIVNQCLARKVPVVSGWASMARAGALLTYGPNLNETYKRVGWFVMRVLGGAQPANLPIEQPTAFELVINKKTANALGLTLPVSLLAQADEVIE